MTSEIDENHKIEALTSALQKTKDELIHWTLMTDEDGDTAIHLAIIRDDANLCLYLCRLLAAQGIELDIKNKLLQTPLHLACITGHSKLVQNLLELNATKIECGDRFGNTCLHLAAKHGDVSCDTMRILLNHLFENDDCDDIINIKNIQGYSALHIASSINKPEAIKLLVGHKADIDQLDTKSGKSPLYIAVQEKNIEAAKVLLELGADANKLTFFRDSPSQLASSQDRRQLLRLISRYDTSSQPTSPPPFGRRNSRRVSDVMIRSTHELNHLNVQLERKLTKNQVNRQMSSANSEPKSDAETQRRNVIVKNSLNVEQSLVPQTTSIRNEIREHTTPVKEEQRSTSPLPYPIPNDSSASFTTNDKFNTSTSPSIQQLQSRLDKLHRAKEQHSRFIAGEPMLPPMLSPASMISQRLKSSKQAFATPQQLNASGIFKGQGTRQPEARDRANREADLQAKVHFQKVKAVTSRSGGTTKTSCVTLESPAKSIVSKRSLVSSKSVGEPLDLSHHTRDNTTPTVLALENTNTNMLLDTKMNVEVENTKSKEYVAEDDNIRSKVKKEVVSDDPDSVPRGEPSPPTMQQDQRLPSQADFTSFQKFSGQNSFVPFVNPWLNFQGAIINPNAFLPQTAYGYIPTGLNTGATTQLHPSLATFDPNSIPQRNPFAAGISQWVNLSLDVARAVGRLRQPHVDGETVDQATSRKRKVADDIENQSSSSKESESESVLPSHNSIEKAKRFRPHNSTIAPSEGLHRSASDDPGKTREKDEDLGSIRSLKRRNSAPSTGVVTQILEQEEQRRVAPVDLHSYAGCLPPHCLHLLQSSGNLAMSNREHALKGIEEVYQARNRAAASTNGHTTPPNDLRFPHPATSSLLTPNNAILLPKNGANRTIELSHNHESDFRMVGRRPSSPSKFPSTTNPILYRELWRPNGREEDSRSSKMNSTKTLPLQPKATYLPGTQKPETWGSYRGKTQNSLVLSHKDRRRSGERARKPSETESDDEDYIQTLQISDASSDDEDYSETRENSLNTTKSRSEINFGRGAWVDLDLGNLPAFGGNIAVPTPKAVPQLNYTSIFSATPTKMACSVIKNYPKGLNGLPRIYTSTKTANAERKSSGYKAYAHEFMPHDVITEPRKELQLSDLPISYRQSTREARNHKCRGCSNNIALQDESRLKLIGDILQQSFNNKKNGGFQSTTPHCSPRLVFTSEIKPPGEVQRRKELATAEEKQLNADSTTDFVTTTAIEAKSRNSVETSSKNLDSEYSHKLFKFARAVKENNNREAAKRVVEKDITKSTNVSAEKRNSILSGSSVLASRTRNSSSSSNKLNSLDAKLEELRQKATEREEMNKLVQGKEPTASDGKVINVKTEVTQSEQRTDVMSPSRSQTSVIFDTKRKLSQSPFQETENGRFGRKNVAVIKPNQSVVAENNQRDNIPLNVCPPKKRHMKRYSPEFYNKPRREVVLQDREVRSASPLPQKPFVSTNVLIDNEDRSLNVRWCSPDRSPTRRKHAQNARTILTYRVPLGPFKPLRGSNSHTVRLEQNYRKHPRYSSSPRSDTVIVVESRVQDGLGDERDERLEIGDLEISDDEN